MFYAVYGRTPQSFSISRSRYRCDGIPDGRYNQCYTSWMKTAISIPDRVFQSAEKLAARLGVSRSELYATALAALIEKHSEAVITAQLNEVYVPEWEQSSLDRDVSRLQSRSLPREKW